MKADSGTARGVAETAGIGVGESWATPDRIKGSCPCL